MISSWQNPLVKQLRKLHEPKGRREQNCCLLEGTHLLQAAWETNYPLRIFCHTSQWQAAHPQLWQAIAERAQRVEAVTPEVLARMATTVNPDGAIAAVPRREAELSTRDPLSLGLVVERLQDPGNLGTIMRTAVAAGADGLWLSADSVDLDHPKVIRASAGEWLRLRVAAAGDLTQIICAYRDHGIQIVATLPRSPLTYWEIDFRQPTLVLLGNEGAGLSPELAALADKKVQIPLSGGVESLNVGIAAALLLYEAQRQRREQQQI